jgi:hypothetical protein
MGAGRRHLSARAAERALAAQPIGGPVVELAPSSYAGRDAPPATLTRWQGGQWGTLSWADVAGWMQTAEASGATTDWARLTRRMYQDGHLLALRGTRVDPVAGAGYDVAPGGPTQADALAAQDVAGMLASLSDLPTYLDAILDAEFVGWSVLEIMWGVRGSWVWPEGMEILEPHRFRFDRLIKPYLWDDGRLANSPGANPQIGLTGLPLRENKSCTCRASFPTTPSRRDYCERAFGIGGSSGLRRHTGSTALKSPGIRAPSASIPTRRLSR